MQARLVIAANDGTDIYPRRDGEQDCGDGVLQSELAGRDTSLLLLRAELGKLPPGRATPITSQQQLAAVQAALAGPLQSIQEETTERVKASRATAEETLKRLRAKQLTLTAVQRGSATGTKLATRIAMSEEQLVGIDSWLDDAAALQLVTAATSRARCRCRLPPC